MASASDARTERLWFEAEPLHPAPRRPGPARRRLRDDPAAERQMELRIPPPRPVRASQTAAPAAQRPAAAPPPSSPSPPPAPAAPPPAPEPESPPSAAVPFGAWLLDQANRRGTLGELAKAARADRMFPRKGDADAVRARFSAAGADGDAFEALDDAERDYERQKQ